MIRTRLALALKAALVAAFLLAGVAEAPAQTYPGQGVTINVAAFPYQADTTGVADSTTAIQNAINALPASGGIVQFPPGTYKISSTLNVGNGSAVAGSTKTGVILAGLVPPQADIFGGFAVQPGAQLLWAGAASGTMLKVAGPLQGWGLQNLFFNCNAVTGTVGVNVVSAMYGDIFNDFFSTCFAGISSSTVETFGSFNVTDSLHNSYRNLVFAVPNQLNAAGMVLQGSGSATPTSNTDYNILDNLYCGFPAAPSVAIFCLNIGVADSNIIRDIHSSGGNANVTSIAFNYQVAANFPASNIIYGADPNGSIGTSFANFGTPNASAKPNYLFGLIETNGATAPNLANLAVFGSKNVILSTGANNTNGQMSVDTAGHIGFKGTAPTVTAGCNGAGFTITGNDIDGTVQGQTAAATTCTITFNKAYPLAPPCVATGLTAPLTGAVAITTTTLQVSFPSTASFQWNYHCPSVN